MEYSRSNKLTKMRMKKLILGVRRMKKSSCSLRLCFYFLANWLKNVNTLAINALSRIITYLPSELILRLLSPR